MSRRLRVLVFVLASMVAITIVILLLAGGIRPLFVNWDIPSPTERIRQHTVALLQGAASPPPTNSFTHVPNELATCGNWLPEILKRNNDQYSIVIVGVWGDGASPISGGTGTITATVYVVFPDKTRIEMQYYAYSLNLCRLIQDGTGPF